MKSEAQMWKDAIKKYEQKMDDAFDKGVSAADWKKMLAHLKGMKEELAAIEKKPAKKSTPKPKRSTYVSPYKPTADDIREEQSNSRGRLSRLHSASMANNIK